VAIYHFHVGIVSRKTGRSAVAAAAYRSAEKLKSEYDGITHNYSEKSNAVNTAAYQSGERLQSERSSTTHDYTQKRGVVHNEIMLPVHVPPEYSDRSTLWNAVEKSEKRKDAQTARDIDVALPVELDRQEQIALVREYVRENFVDKGMCADFAVHDKSDGNPHAHILLTTREVSAGGFGKKNRDWNSTARLNSWRENWSVACNMRLETDKHIDHRTLKAQGIDRIPTIHVGVSGKALEKKGIITERVRQNREIIRLNKEKQPEYIAEKLHELKENHFLLEKEITELQQISTETQREASVCRITAEQIGERAEQIQKTRNRLDDLKVERQSMGIFQSKKDINRQIEQLDRSNKQATEYFKRTYKIAPEQAGAEVKKLEAISESKKHLQEKLQNKLNPLIERKDMTILEYQRQKLLVDIRPDKEKILNRLSELDKENRAHKGLVQDDIMRSRSQRALDIVTERNFGEILKSVTPKQAKDLAKLRERESIREKLRIFDRGRL
jgi:ATP-dependent exoDNAse (exonuclease V) alpha subunit